jgi:hypothetical protein
MCTRTHNFMLSVGVHKTMLNTLYLIDTDICHYSQQPHCCCHIGYACAGPCHEVFRFCNITIPCHIWCASTMSTRMFFLIAEIVNFLAYMRNALESGHYLAGFTVKLSNIFQCSSIYLSTIALEVEYSLWQYVFQ